jgi:ethanolamine ammonia-lyase large subunit
VPDLPVAATVYSSRSVSASFHDAHFIRKVLGLAPAPEFQQWLHNTGIADTLHEPLQVNSADTALRQLVSHV